MAFGSLLQMIRKYIPESIKRKYRLLRAKLLSIGLGQSMDIVQAREEILASSDISVIIAIHDSPEVTRRCLESVEKYGANAQIILVDDGSQLQETIDLIRDYQQRNGWKVIKHTKALGHSRSCEDAAQPATKPYLCFLNSDTVITPWCWHAAKEALDSDPRIAVTGPATSWTATRQAVRRAEYCRNYWTNNQIYAFAKKYVLRQRPKSWVDLPVVGGFAFFIRRSVWAEFGGFESGLPDYGNESELCKRLSQSGFRIVWTQNSYIHHFGQASYGLIISEATIKERRLAAKDYIKRLHPDSKQN
jgi:GT2 family glycosyltransferase